jgi:hypothetical protein
MCDISSLIDDLKKLKLSIKKKHLITDYYNKCDCEINIFTKNKTCDLLNCINKFVFDKNIFRIN